MYKVHIQYVLEKLNLQADYVNVSNTWDSILVMSVTCLSYMYERLYLNTE